jgi:hypothetical protein
VNAPFRNIRFVYNALARSRLRDYGLAQALRNHHLGLLLDVTAATPASTGSLDWWFRWTVCYVIS